MTSPECQLEDEFIEKRRDLKYEYRPDIRDRATLEEDFREKFQALNPIKLTDGEFQRILDEIVTPDVFTAAHTLRNGSSARQGERWSGREVEWHLGIDRRRQKHPAAPRDPAETGSLVARSVWTIKR